MMATVPHVTSGLGLRKFQADGFLLTRVYNVQKNSRNCDVEISSILKVYVYISEERIIFYLMMN